MEAEGKDPKSYEVSFLGRNEKVAGEVGTVLKRHGAEVFLEGPVEHIALAYEIEHESAAYFGYLHFRLDPAQIPGVNHELETNASVLRHLIVTPPIEKAKPRWGKAPRARAVAEPAREEAREEHRPVEQLPLSNEELEKKIEEILH